MFSRLYIKIYVILAGMCLAYTLAMVFVFAPAVEKDTIRLEEETGKTQLAKIAVMVDEVAKSIEDYKNISLNAHKSELKSLVDVTETLVQELYESSKPEAFKKYLTEKGEEFKKILTDRYKKELKLNGKQAARKAVIDLIDVYRYDQGKGYFYALRDDTKLVLHPIKPELNGLDFGHIKGPDGNTLPQITEMVLEVLKQGEGYASYLWPNPKTNHPEEKLTYGFLFEPLNWVIATGFYLPEVTRDRQQKAIDYIKNLSYAKNNYFFISNYDNVIISHPYLQGRDFTDIHDIHGNLIIPPAVKIAREKGEGFNTYWWKKNTDDDTPYEKLLYSRNFPAWQWVLSTGVYIDDVQKEVESRKKRLIEQLHETLKHTVIGKTGYVYIFDADANVIIHPDPAWEGKNFKDFKVPGSETKMFDDLIAAYQSGEKTMYYKWEKLGDKGNFIYNKVLWIEYNPYFDWYICSTAYLNEFNHTSDELKKFILVFTLTVLFLTFLLGMFFFGKLLKPIVQLSEKTKLIKKGDFSIRSEVRRNDEIGDLSETFDEMLDTIEENIRTLDQKVNDKTKKLTQSNQQLEDSIKELQATQKQLVESEKMAALGGLVAGVSHEVNTPVGMALTGITHLLDELRRLMKKYEAEEMSEEDFTEFISLTQELGRSIEVNLNRAANLVRSFKQVAVDQSSEEMREFYVREYVEEILTSLHNRVKKTKHHIVLEIDPELKIRNYPGAFSQIIANLILNSLVHAYEDEDEGRIALVIRKEGEKLVFSYRDDGKGIPEENLKKIFDPFFTTNREKGGSGLGMNIIYNIITQQLKGEITCHSQLGEGVEFIITMPYHSPDSGE